MFVCMPVYILCHTEVEFVKSCYVSFTLKKICLLSLDPCIWHWFGIRTQSWKFDVVDVWPGIDMHQLPVETWEFKASREVRYLLWRIPCMPLGLGVRLVQPCFEFAVCTNYLFKPMKIWPAIAIFEMRLWRRKIYPMVALWAVIVVRNQEIVIFGIVVSLSVDFYSSFSFSVVQSTYVPAGVFLLFHLQISQLFRFVHRQCLCCRIRWRPFPDHEPTTYATDTRYDANRWVQPLHFHRQ